MIKKYKKELIVIALLIAAYAIGRHTAPTKIETKTVTVEKEHKQEDTNIITVEEIKPDGTKTTTTKTETKIVTDTNTNSKESQITQNNTGQTNVSILAGMDVLNPKLVYGASITRTVFGPFGIGVWGVSNGTVGASVGIQF